MIWGVPGARMRELAAPGGSIRVSTEAAEPAIAQKGVWRLETPNGSMAPRSALDVLVDLNDRVTSGKVGEFQPIPLGFTPPDDNAHAPNESMSLTNHETAIRTLAAYWSELAALPR